MVEKGEKLSLPKKQSQLSGEIPKYGARSLSLSLLLLSFPSFPYFILVTAQIEYFMGGEEERLERPALNGAETKVQLLIPEISSSFAISLTHPVMKFSRLVIRCELLTRIFVSSPFNIHEGAGRDQISKLSHDFPIKILGCRRKATASVCS